MVHHVTELSKLFSWKIWLSVFFIFITSNKHVNTRALAKITSEL